MSKDTPLGLGQFDLDVTGDTESGKVRGRGVGVVGMEQLCTLYIICNAGGVWLYIN